MEKDLPIFYPNRNFMDRAIKWLLWQSEQMRELLEILAPEILPSLNFRAYEKVDHSRISEELHERESDALFKIGLSGSQEAFVYLLVEHQSQADNWIRYRFLQAQAMIWRISYDRQETARRKEQKEEKREISLPPIIPILFYTGEKAWDIQSLSKSLKFPEVFHPFTPESRILSLGLYMQSGEKLLASGSVLGESCRLLTLVEQEKERFKEEMSKIHLRIVEIYEEDRAVYRRFLHFVVSLIYHKRAAEEREEMIEFVKSCVKQREVEEVEKMQKTAADVMFEKGIEEGIEEGIEKGIEKGEAKARREAIFRIFKARFGELPESVEREIGRIRQEESLLSLVELSATCHTLADFEREMKLYE